MPIRFICVVCHRKKDFDFCGYCYCLSFLQKQTIEVNLSFLILYKYGLSLLSPTVTKLLYILTNGDLLTKNVLITRKKLEYLFHFNLHFLTTSGVENQFMYLMVFGLNHRFGLDIFLKNRL